MFLCSTYTHTSCLLYISIIYIIIFLLNVNINYFFYLRIYYDFNSYIIRIVRSQHTLIHNIIIYIIPDIYSNLPTKQPTTHPDLPRNVQTLRTPLPTTRIRPPGDQRLPIIPAIQGTRRCHHARRFQDEHCGRRDHGTQIS